MDGPAPARAAGLVVAIDGPAGAGKTTVAKGVATALGLAHLDTGAMYRALTAKALGEGIDAGDGDALASLADRTRMEFTAAGLSVDGRPAGPEIRTREVNGVVSVVSAHAAVRQALVRKQQQIMQRGGIVAEGRDIGTVVYPDAPVKVFLVASVEERARRRHAEVANAGEDVSLDAMQREITDRDRLDSSRVVSPLVPAPDAAIIDTTDKTAQQVVDEVVAMAAAIAAGEPD